MNVQRLIDKFEERKTIIGNFQGYAVWWEDVKEILEQLDEPQPVKVPQCVADMIEGARGQSVELEDAFEYAREVATIEFREWFRKLENRNNFARAWLDGYEVEEEKRYYVRFKWIEDSYSYLTFIKHLHAWTLTNIKLDKKFRSEHTQKQLEEAGFGWVFSCPGIEIEEVID